MRTELYDKILEQIEKLMDSDPEPESKDGLALNLLTEIITDYESKNNAELHEKRAKLKKKLILEINANFLKDAISTLFELIEIQSIIVHYDYSS